MPTIFSHAVFVTALGKALQPSKPDARFWMLTVACAILPDLDVISFGFGINYSSVLGHRGLTHSILFAFILGLIVSFLVPAQNASRWKLALYFGAVTVSHPLLDMLTNGGLGVALLAPFSNERFFFPWQPVEVSPIGLGFFSERGLGVIASEIVWIWIPAVIVFAVSWLLRRKWR
jgi:inner membrane protein